MAIPHLRFGGYMTVTSGGTNAAASSSYGGGGGGGGGGGSSNQQRPPVFGSGGAGGGGGSSGDYDDDKNPAIPQPDNNQGDNNQGDNNQEDSQVTETKVETKKKKNKFVQEILNLGSDISSMGGVIGMAIQGGAKGLDVLFQKLLRTKPTPELLNDPRTLAVLNREFAKDPTGNFRKVFEEKYADIIKEAYEDDPTKEVRELSDSDFFDEQLQENAFASEQGILGAGSQRINFPEEFYTGEKGLNPYGPGGMPQTTNDLVNLASLAVTPEMQGNNPKLAKMIFDARMELDRMGKDSSGNPQGGGSTGIPSLYGGPITPSDPNAILKKPGLKNPFGLPDDYSSGFMQSEFYKPNQPGLAVMTPVKMPDGTTHMFGNSASANQFQQYLDYLAMNKMGPSTGTPQAVGTSTGVPAAFNYASIAPQFTGSQYTNQGVSPAFLENLRRFYG